MAFPAAACSGRARPRDSTSRAGSSAGHVQVDRDDAVDAQARPLDDGNELLIVQAALDGHLTFLHVHRHVGGCQTRHPDQDVAGHLLRQGVVQLLDRDIPTGGAVRRLGEPDRPGGIGAPSDLADQIRFLDRHGAGRDGFSVRAGFRMADDRPPRVASLRLTVTAPSLPAEKLAALRAVVSHCTVTNTLAQAPEVMLEVRGTPSGETDLGTETSAR